MEEHGISSEAALAREIGVSQQNVNRVLSGGGTSLAFVSKVCDWLDSDVGELFRARKAAPSANIRTLASHLAKLATLDGEMEVARWLADFASVPQSARNPASD